LVPGSDRRKGEIWAAVEKSLEDMHFGSTQVRAPREHVDFDLFLLEILWIVAADLADSRCMEPERDGGSNPSNSANMHSGLGELVA
jgi:hypothetical protein